MRLWITGASGLLGGCLLRRASAEWRAAGSARTARPGLPACDIGDRDAVRRFVEAGGFTHILHAAALRDPEYCRTHPDETRRTNAEGSRHVAEAAAGAGARLLYISTDYVFDGARPPYREEDEPAPLNRYGRSKREGELAALSIPNALVVRIPALYRLDLADPRNVLSGLADRLAQGTPLAADGATVRYYTLADDVADALLFLLARSDTGLLHVSAEEASTKASFLRAAAVRFGYPPSAVVDAPPDASGALRPRDSHLATGRYRAFGGPHLRPPSELLPLLPRLAEA